MERHEKLNFEIEMSRKIQLNETLNLLVEHTQKKIEIQTWKTLSFSMSDGFG